MCCIFLLFRRCDGTWGWEPFCGSKTLCLTKLGKTRNLLAKSDVDNVGAGRAAKGASPGRSTSSLFRRYAPYCLNHGKSFETKGFKAFFFSKNRRENHAWPHVWPLADFSLFLCAWNSSFFAKNKKFLFFVYCISNFEGWRWFRHPLFVAFLSSAISAFIVFISSSSFSSHSSLVFA